MDNAAKNCYHQDHSNIEAVYYCIECKIYMCNKCENFHSKLCKFHHKYTLDKNKTISEIFTGFCKEENHSDKLEYFCKNHNQLCCSGCIAKLKRKDKGQHTDCEICLIEDIKESKEKILEENILNLEKLSNEIDKLIKEIKDVFEKINKDKEELKLNIQKIFTKIRNNINDREDEILLNVDEIFDNTYIKEKEMNDIDKYPNKISILLKQGKSTIDQWKNEKELSLLINNCINIEKNLMKINNIEQNLKKSKGAMSSEIKFSPSEYELEDFISILTTFGKIFKEKKGENEENKNNLEQNIFEQNIFDIEIKTTNEELNELSIELSNFSQKEYNIYYSNDINYKENEIVLTFHFGIEDGYIKEIIESEKLFKKLSKKFNEPFSLRKKENKLFLDFKINIEEIEKITILLFFYYLHKFIFNLSSVSIKFKNNLTFE